MKKVLKKLCFIAVLLNLFSCEKEPNEYEYSVTNEHLTYDEIYHQELITDMIYIIESDKNNIILNKRKIEELKTNETITFVVSSSIKTVYAVYRLRAMNNDGSPDSIVYFKTKIYNLSSDDIQNIRLDGYYSCSTMSENEFYNIIN